MRQRGKQALQSAQETVRNIRRATRRQFSAEEKIRIVVDRLGGEDSIAELCRAIAERCFNHSARASPRSMVQRRRGLERSEPAVGSQAR